MFKRQTNSNQPLTQKSSFVFRLHKTKSFHDNLVITFVSTCQRAGLVRESKCISIDNRGSLPILCLPQLPQISFKCKCTILKKIYAQLSRQILTRLNEKNRCCFLMLKVLLNIFVCFSFLRNNWTWTFSTVCVVERDCGSAINI